MHYPIVGEIPSRTRYPLSVLNLVSQCVYSALISLPMAVAALPIIYTDRSSARLGILLVPYLSDGCCVGYRLFMLAIFPRTTISHVLVYPGCGYFAGIRRPDCKRKAICLPSSWRPHSKQPSSSVFGKGQLLIILKSCITKCC